MDFRFRVIDLIIALRCLIVVQNDFVLLIILDNRKRWFSFNTYRNEMSTL